MIDEKINGKGNRKKEKNINIRVKQHSYLLLCLLMKSQKRLTALNSLSSKKKMGVLRTKKVKNLTDVC